MRTLDEIRADREKALNEHEEARKAYEPYMAQTNLAPGENSMAIIYEDLKAATGRLWAARTRLGEIELEYSEAIRHWRR